MNEFKEVKMMQTTLEGIEHKVFKEAILPECYKCKKPVDRITREIDKRFRLLNFNIYCHGEIEIIEERIPHSVPAEEIEIINPFMPEPSFRLMGLKRDKD